MENLEYGQQTLTRNINGSVAIAVRAQPADVILPLETLLRAHHQLAAITKLEHAKAVQLSFRDKTEVVVIKPQKDNGLMSTDNPLLPIPQVGLATDPVQFDELYLKGSGLTFLDWVEVEEKGKFVRKMKVLV